MPYRFKKVELSADVDQFHRLPFRLYRDYPNWRPPFRFEIEQIFDPERNDFFQKGECERFLVFDNSRVVARFAVMNTPDRDKVLEPTMGGIGFIEMENDQELANQLI